MAQSTLFKHHVKLLTYVPGNVMYLRSCKLVQETIIRHKRYQSGSLETFRNDAAHR